MPPSSSETFFTVEPTHAAPSFLPTSVEPVKEKWRTSGLSHITLPTAAALSVVTTLNTPLGMPAFSASSASASAVSGVWCGGFSTMVQPAAIAGAALRVIIAIGKFHGVTAAHTPIGCLSVT